MKTNDAKKDVNETEKKLAIAKKLWGVPCLSYYTF